MSVRSFKQINAIITQEYFEPTISWAVRVVFALNVPLIVLPLYFGFSFDVIWAAFGAYLITLTDYRGLQYKKIIIQSLQTVLVIGSAILGMSSAWSITTSVLAMFAVGMFAAFVRNWSDYGANIGVSVGFFFLFGLANPVSDGDMLQRILYLFAGCSWAIAITILVFPLRPSNPVKRSVAKIWKANTELLDAMVDEELFANSSFIAEKEMGIRTAINQSIDLFQRNAGSSSKLRHYDLLMELRRLTTLFSAALSSLQEELEIIRVDLKMLPDAALNKTLSSFAQCSARLSIVSYTSRPEDLLLAKVRLARCEVAMDLLKEAAKNFHEAHHHDKELNHFIYALERAYSYMEQCISILEKKSSLQKTDYFESYKLSFNNFVAGVQSWIILDFFRNLFNINSEQFRYALRVALLLCLGVFVFKYFKIDHGYWIPLTMIIVIQPYYGATRKKGIERIIGTSAGIVLGGLIMLLPLPHEAFVGLLVVVSFFVAYFLRNNYKVGVFFVTIMMVILMQITEQGSLELIGWRVLSTMIGALFAFAAGYILWPVWEKERFPGLMQKALRETENYLNTVLLFVNKEHAPQSTWYRNRRLSAEASNHVFASVQRMTEEPSRRQGSADISFTLVGACLRLNREITSIALIAEREKNRKQIHTLDIYRKELFKLFQLLNSYFDEETTETLRPDFETVKNALKSKDFLQDENTEMIKNELEKIVFELEAMFKLREKSK